MIVIKPLKDIPQFAQQIKTHLLCEFGLYEFGKNIETLVAHDGNTFVGTVSLCDCDIEHGKYSTVGPWMSDLFVVSEYRGRGVGRMLVESIVKIHQRLSQRGLFLWTSDTKLVRFYESLGFTFLELINYKPDKIISVMYK